MSSARARATAAYVLLCAAASTGSAASPPVGATRVDDTGTVVSAPLVVMRWRDPVPGRGASNDVDGEFDVELRLAVGHWMNRDVRLYLVFEPPLVPGMSIAARWQTGGRFLPGSVRSGGRTLVFQGRITEPTLREKLRFNLTTDGGRLPQSQALQFHIEAEQR
jgi:hypothetical protein